MKIFSKEGSTGNFVCQSTLRGHTDPVRSVCFSPCGEKIASGGGDYFGNEDYSIRIWDAKTGEQIGSPLRGKKPIRCVAFSPDGSLITAGYGGHYEAGTIRLYNAATGDPFGSPLTVAR